jgi:hypothetical protein
MSAITVVADLVAPVATGTSTPRDGSGRKRWCDNNTRDETRTRKTRRSGDFESYPGPRAQVSLGDSIGVKGTGPDCSVRS